NRRPLPHSGECCGQTGHPYRPALPAGAMAFAAGATVERTAGLVLVAALEKQAIGEGDVHRWCEGSPLTGRDRVVTGGDGGKPVQRIPLDQAAGDGERTYRPRP